MKKEFQINYHENKRWCYANEARIQNIIDEINMKRPDFSAKMKRGEISILSVRYKKVYAYITFQLQEPLRNYKIYCDRSGFPINDMHHLLDMIIEGI